jgi:hypothetical protein
LWNCLCFKQIEFFRAKVQKDSREFYQMMIQYKCVPKINSLHNWAHWITPKQERWRYDTYFFLAIMDDDDTSSQNLEHDSNSFDSLFILSLKMSSETEIL